MSAASQPLESVLVIGVGTVGFTKGVALESHGHNVLFVDTSPERRSELRSQGISCVEDYELAIESQIAFLCVPTPATDSGYDLSILRCTLEHLGAKLKQSGARHLVVICSTVPPRTIRTIVVPTLEAVSGLQEGVGFDVAAVPEFVRQSRALEDAQHPWITVIASSGVTARERLTALFEPLGGELRVFDDPLMAELIKTTHNAFNAAKISFFNEIHQLATSMGVNGFEVSEVVSKSAEASFNTNYGIRGGAPFGGHCLPKDLDGLISFAREVGVPVPMLHATRSVNQSFESAGLKTDNPPEYRTGPLDVRRYLGAPKVVRQRFP